MREGERCAAWCMTAMTGLRCRQWDGTKKAGDLAVDFHLLDEHDRLVGSLEVTQHIEADHARHMSRLFRETKKLGTTPSELNGSWLVSVQGKPHASYGLPALPDPRTLGQHLVDALNRADELGITQLGHHSYLWTPEAVLPQAMTSDERERLALHRRAFMQIGFEATRLHTVPSPHLSVVIASGGITSKDMPADTAEHEIRNNERKLDLADGWKRYLWVWIDSRSPWFQIEDHFGTIGVPRPVDTRGLVERVVVAGQRDAYIYDAATRTWQQQALPRVSEPQ